MKDFESIFTKGYCSVGLFFFLPGLSLSGFGVGVIAGLMKLMGNAPSSSIPWKKLCRIIVHSSLNIR